MKGLDAVQWSLFWSLRFFVHGYMILLRVKLKC